MRLDLDLERLTPGRRLRVQRVVAGLKLWELAAEAGINQGRVSELENDRRSGTPQELERIAAVLQRAPDAAQVPA